MLALLVLASGLNPLLAQEAIDLEVEFDEGVVAYSEGQYMEALQKFEAVLAQEPDNAEAHQYRGMCLINTDKLDEGIKELKAAQDLNPDLEGILLPIGNAYIKANRLDEAIDNLRKAEADEPENLEVKFSLGYAYFLKDEYKKAQPLLEAAKEDPIVAQRAWLYAGLSAINLKQRDRARMALVEAIRLDPSSEEGELARHYFDSLEEIPEKKKWAISLSVLYQYDSNVAAVNDDADFPLAIRDTDISQKDDHRAVVSFYGAYQPIENEFWSFGMSYSYYQSFHAEVKPFNLMYHNPKLNLARWLKIGDYRSSVFLRYDYGVALLGEDVDMYSQTHRASPGFAIQWTKSILSELTYQFNADDFDFEGDDVRDNTSHGAGLINSYYFMKKKAFVALNLVFANEDARDESYDINRFISEISLGLPLPLKINARLSAAYELEDHFNDDLLGRKDNIFRTNLIINRQVSGPLSFVSSFSYRNNDSNIDALTYDRFVAGSGFSLNF